MFLIKCSPHTTYPHAINSFVYFCCSSLWLIILNLTVLLMSARRNVNKGPHLQKANSAY